MDKHKDKRTTINQPWLVQKQITVCRGFSQLLVLLCDSTQGASLLLCYLFLAVLFVDLLSFINFQGVSRKTVQISRVKHGNADLTQNPKSLSPPPSLSLSFSP